MAEFFSIEDRPEVMDLYGTTALSKPERRKSYTHELANLYAMVLEIPYNNAAVAIEAGLEAELAESARSKALQGNSVRQQEEIRQSIIEVSPLEDITAKAEEGDRASAAIEQTKSPEIAAGLYGQLANAWDEQDRRRSMRLGTIAKAFDEQLEEADTSVFGYGWAIVDMIFSALPETISGGGFTRGRYAEQIVQALEDPSISEAEFNQMVTGLVQEVADSGWLSDNNPLFTSGFAAVVAEGGSGPASTADRVFTSMDIAGVAAPIGIIAGKGLARGSRALTQARDAADSVTTLAGREAGVQATEGALRGERGGVDVPGRMYGDPYMAPTQSVRYSFINPSAEGLRRVEVENNYLDAVISQDFGSFVDQQMLAAAKPRLMQIVNQSIENQNIRRVHMVQVNQDELGNLFGEVTYGKVDGTPFSTQGSAQAIANKIGGEVIPVVNGGNEMFLVRQVKNLPTKGLVQDMSAEELNNNLLQAFSSTFLTTSRRLDPQIKRGEAGLGNVFKGVAREHRKIWRRTNNKERQTIDQIFLKLRDGDDSARLKPYSEDEFRVEYRRLTGEEPSDAAVNLYVSELKLNDVAYILKADPIFKEAVNRGEEVLMIRGGPDGIENYRVMRKARPQDEEEGVRALNLMTGEIEDVDFDNGGLFSVIGGYRSGNKVHETIYVPNDLDWDLRRLYHSDVLGYRPGGPREYTEAKWWVKQDTTVTAQSGDAVRRTTGLPKTFMGTVLEKEAKKAANAMNFIFKEATVGLRTGATRLQAVEFVKAQRGDPYLNDIIRANNEWNPDIESVDDLVRFLEETEINPNKEVGVAASGEEIRLAGDGTEFDIVSGFSRGTTYGDVHTLRSNRPYGRQEKALRGYGGQTLETRPPIDRIENSFTRAVQRVSQEAYLNQAIEGWLKGAKSDIKNWNDIQGLPLIQQLRLADISTKTKKGRLFDQERNVIMRRIHAKSKLQEQIEQKVDILADWVYEKRGGSTSRMRDMLSTDPTVALRALAFNLKLGLFAFDQFFVQASQTWNILAIAGPTQWRGIAAGYFPVQMALLNGTDDVIRTIGRRTAAFTGFSEEEFFDVVTFMRDSGRQVVDRTVIEQSQGEFALAKGAAAKFSDLGRIPFNAGELVPRIAAMLVSYREFKRLYPGASIRSEAARNWIMTRQDVLTAGMTQASAAAWQKNAASVPLQFMSYTSRMMEQLFAGTVGGRQILTKKERLRLASAQFLLWGAAGVPFGSTILEQLRSNGYLTELDSDFYTAARYGMIDTAIGQLTDANTAFADRLAIWEGAYDMFQRITDQETNWMEIAGGPGYSVSKDAVGATLQSIQSTISGSWDVAKLDWNKALRNLSSYNRAHNAWMLYHYGNYYSRHNNLIASQLGADSAFFTAMGAPLQEVNLAYEVADILKNEDEHILQLGRRLHEKANLARDLMDEGNFEAAIEVHKEIATEYQTMPLYIRKELDSFLKPPVGGMFESIMKEALKRDNPYGMLMREMELEGKE